jgi:hypothetical protein
MKMKKFNSEKINEVVPKFWINNNLIIRLVKINNEVKIIKSLLLSNVIKLIIEINIKIKIL